MAVMRVIYPLLFGAGTFLLCQLASVYWPTATKRTLPWLAVIAGWGWCFFAGGGGLGILLIRGPWPPTNGWFALVSGLATCPLWGRALRNPARPQLSGWYQFTAAVLLIAMGRLALTVWPQPHPL